MMKIALCAPCNNAGDLRRFARSVPKRCHFVFSIFVDNGLTVSEAKKITADSYGEWRFTTARNLQSGGLFNFCAARERAANAADDCDVIVAIDLDSEFAEARPGLCSWAIGTIDAINEAARAVTADESIGIVCLRAFLGGAPSAGSIVDAPVLDFGHDRGLVFRQPMIRYMPRDLFGAGCDDNLFALNVFIHGYRVVKRFGVLTRCTRKAKRLESESKNYCPDTLNKNLHKAYAKLIGVPDARYIIGKPIPREAKILHEAAK